MGWTNQQAETITGIAFTYLASTVLFSTGSALTLDSGATFTSETDINLADAELEVRRTVSAPNVGMVRLWTDGIPLAPERIIDARRVDTDTIAPFIVLGPGRIEWGAGGAAARDVVLQRTAAGVLTLTGRLVTDGKQVGRGIIAAYFTTAGTVITTAATEAALTAWDASSSGAVTWRDGYMYRVALRAGVYNSNGTEHLADVRVRKTVNSTAAQQLAVFRAQSGAENSTRVPQNVNHWAFIQNASGGPITDTPGVTIQREFGTGNVSLYGDASVVQCIFTIEELGPITDYPALAAIATAIT